MSTAEEFHEQYGEMNLKQLKNVAEYHDHEISYDGYNASIEFADGSELGITACGDNFTN